MSELVLNISGEKIASFVDLPREFRDAMLRITITRAEEEPNYALNLGFLDLPPIPDSFFEPLSEEELALWE